MHVDACGAYVFANLSTDISLNGCRGACVVIASVGLISRLPAFDRGLGGSTTETSSEVSLQYFKIKLRFYLQSCVCVTAN